MSISNGIEYIVCPFCQTRDSTLWASELGWNLVKCSECGYLYCNPRPDQQNRKKSTQLGVHESAQNLDISERRIVSKIKKYQKIFNEMYDDVWASGRLVTWIDIGAGYGEVVEALLQIAPSGSNVLGLEPMLPKVEAARKMGLNIIEGYIDKNTPVCQFASIINIFSHVYDFDDFLQQISLILEPEGELFIETADLTDVLVRNHFPGILGLPDHVSFATERHLRGFLERNGFNVIKVKKIQKDDLLFSIKELVKKLIGQNVKVTLPYTSPYRSMLVRAKKIK